MIQRVSHRYQTCQLCGCALRRGPLRYEGRYLALYDLLLCDGCSDATAAGFADSYAERLERHLDRHGIERQEPDGGRFPRPKE